MSRAQYDYAIAGCPLVARRARVADIITIAANLSGVTVAELMGKRRLKRISRVRFAIYAIALENGHSANATGLRCGKDRSSVLHGCERLAEYVKRDPDYAAFVDELRELAAVTKPFAGSRDLAAALAEARAG